MSDITINISGGNNQILPNATKAIQNFYGELPAASQWDKTPAQEESLPEAEQLSIYIDKVNLPGYLSLLGECRTATELAKVVISMVEQEPRLTAEEMVKGRFISLLLPFASKLTKGTSVDNIRARINDAWSNRPRHRP